MSGLRIIFAGSGAFGLPTLKALGAAVVQVVSQPDHAAGRGLKLAATAVSQFAIEHSLPLLRTADINAETLADADAMVVIAFGQKISRAIADRPRLGSVNLHASLLPKYRGAAPINWAILRGETVSGNSVIRLADRMDAGDVLGQSTVEISASETAGELHDRLSENGAGLVVEVLEQLAAGRCVPRPQEEGQASGAPKLKRTDAMIDFSRPGEEVARRVCGLWPWPGCRVCLTDAAGGVAGHLALARARPVGGEGARWQDGEIETSGCICVGGGAAAVEILEVQPQGKRLMTLDEYRRGHAWQAGMRVGSDR